MATRLTHGSFQPAEKLNGLGRERRHGYVAIDGHNVHFEAVAHELGAVLHVTVDEDGPEVIIHRGTRKEKVV